MTDEGRTHYHGDSCPGGHAEAQTPDLAQRAREIADAIRGAVEDATVAAREDKEAAERERDQTRQVCAHFMYCWTEAEKEVRAAEAERDALRKALEEIAATPCAIPGHSVATGCRANGIARRAIDHEKELA